MSDIDIALYEIERNGEIPETPSRLRVMKCIKLLLIDKNRGMVTGVLETHEGGTHTANIYSTYTDSLEQFLQGKNVFVRVIPRRRVEWWPPPELEQAYIIPHWRGTEFGNSNQAQSDPPYYAPLHAQQCWLNPGPTPYGAGFTSFPS